MTSLAASTERQRPWLLRAVWFVFIGWWLGALWLTAAWLIGLLVVTWAVIVAP
ncbi:MAG: hypothetical protein M3P34_01580 [Actinomycetota bacterium]|nr:hypothetical protein [Actinomycetota bacterium]